VDPLIAVESIGIGLLIGAVIGLFGGGGGIVAVPLLVVIGYGVLEATTVSLIVVLAGSLAGVLVHGRAGRIDWSGGLTFGVLGIVGAIAGSRLALSTSARVQLLSLAALLLISGAAMVRKAVQSRPAAGADVDSRPVTRVSLPRAALPASALGGITGFLGVSGGFLVVPALSTFLGVAVRRAAATALVVACITSTTALIARGPLSTDLGQAALIAASAVAASLVSSRLSSRVPERLLAAGFAALVIVMALFTLSRAIGTG
jgi:uncharacterized membrane protein YfcA